MDCLAIESHVGKGLAFLEDGDERGGVTGQLFEILRDGTAPFLRKGKKVVELLLGSPRDEDGLTW